MPSVVLQSSLCFVQSNRKGGFWEPGGPGERNSIATQLLQSAQVLCWLRLNATKGKPLKKPESYDGNGNPCINVFKCVQFQSHCWACLNSYASILNIHFDCQSLDFLVNKSVCFL